ncbi:hypothetical protein BJ986_002609 [Phycicoccus badiiscoriae]|uniref:Bacterial spore germination immunoglobulin-like domain-containing protein n=1 Tax=Pedococcus badiiscoriae TaxID=642776 RepID=A0A852WSD0_9MICO|nr:Gmad2 immunoglobulin-like domain-containing protein [Pedococcus badiiscoriae]NYG08122.1 hypothetical protein [Pedococcus badiiscoriae]
MSDRTDFLHPDSEPGEFDQVERRLRRALIQDAQQVRPSHRLDTILHEAHEAGPVTATGGSGARRWVMPLAAAAAVAAIIGGLWWSGHDDGPTITPPQTSGPSQSATSAPTSSTTSPGTAPPTGAGTTKSVALPVYFVGPIGDAKPTYKLFREFVSGAVPVGGGDAKRVEVALGLAMNAQPFSNTNGYLQPWSGTRVTAATVTPDAIQVTLSSPGAAGFDAETQRLAVQELVWTAQAAAQKTLPVRFQVADGSTTLFGSISTAQAFTRPPSDRLYEDIAPIWITSPTGDQVLPKAKPVVVRGLAIVFEATVNWQLERGTTTVSTGHAMATIGAPMQGSYSIDLGRLTAGSYTIHVRELSAKDGSVSAEKAVSFTVR